MLRPSFWHGGWCTFLTTSVLISCAQIWHSIHLLSIPAAPSSSQLLPRDSTIALDSQGSIEKTAILQSPSTSRSNPSKKPRFPVSTNEKGNSVAPAVGSFGQLKQFLNEYPDSAGARFVTLLRNHLHVEAGLEDTRSSACAVNAGAHQSANDLILCLTGKNSEENHAIDAANMDKTYFMPLNSTVSVYDMPCYPGTERWIPSLGTLYSCLPLFLAGAAVGPNSTALELGPYFGLSSKCIVSGMKTNGVRENSYMAFDTFDGIANFRSIQNSKRHAWILESYPQFNETSTSFLFLWGKAVLPIYPTATGRAGYISQNTLNYKIIGRREAGSSKYGGIDLISVDSAKAAKSLQSQLAGLGKLKAGTILFLLDFGSVQEHVQLVYGCLRHSGYLLPVYVERKNGENWAFVVTKAFFFSDFEFPSCIGVEKEQRGVNQTYWVEQDLMMLTSLGSDEEEISVTTMSSRMKRLSSKLLETLESIKRRSGR